VLDPRGIYRYDPFVRSGGHWEDPVLLHLLDGYIDAGSVCHGLRKYILEQCEHQMLAEFDHDQVHDYRYRRPQFIFDTNHLDSMIDFSLAVHKVLDANGKPFLLLAGPEPDHQWHRVAEAVFQICEEFSVAKLTSAAGIPMAVPHTRPTLITQHATDPKLVSGNPMWIDRVQLPGSFSHFLEYLAGERGLLGGGFVAHVPHYLAQSSFSQAIGAALEKVNEFTGLAIPTTVISERAAEQLQTIAAETSDDTEFPALVQALEEQYDRLRESGAASVPSADEIGAAVERFLAEQDPPDRAR
jgi:hypothetical protein